MLKLSTLRIAQVAIGILILVVIRTLAELIAITSNHPSSDNLNTVYLVGALTAAAAALACHILFAFGKHRLVLLLAGVTILGLIVLKIAPHHSRRDSVSATD
jgi:hypothetical protein